MSCRAGKVRSLGKANVLEEWKKARMECRVAVLC
jgi:hypothetical protein